MKYIILRFAIVVAAVLAAGRLIPGIEVESIYTAVIVALALGLVNLVLRPIVLLLTLPLTILTLGLFTFVVNGLMFWLVSTFVKGFEVGGFAPAFLGALTVSIISFLGNRFVAAVDGDDSK